MLLHRFKEDLLDIWILFLFFKLDFVEIRAFTKTDESEVIVRLHLLEETIEILVGLFLIDYAAKVCVDNENDAPLQESRLHLHPFGLFVEPA